MHKLCGIVVKDFSHVLSESSFLVSQLHWNLFEVFHILKVSPENNIC